MNPVFIILVGTAVVLLCIIRFRLHAALSLLIAAVVTAILTGPEHLQTFAEFKSFNAVQTKDFLSQSVGKRLSNAFGNTSAKVGVLIALASIIGTALTRSGGAEKIIRSILSVLGAKNTSVGLLAGSFTLAIPVFFDTVFYLMIPLIKSLSIRNPKKFGLYLMAVIAGGVMAHSLIPPTPGPLFVAEAMDINLGVMIMAGIIVGAITVSAGYVYALWLQKRQQLPLRNTSDITTDDLKTYSAKTEIELPSLVGSLLPVLLPIFLITGNTFSQMLQETFMDFSQWQQQLFGLFRFLGDPNIALFIACLISLYLLKKQTRLKEKFNQFIKEAVAGASVIILITASGGAFGQMMQQTGVGVYIGGFAANYQIAILPFAFVLTAAIRSAQGSATVAMVTAIGILGGIVETDLLFHPVYIAMAIGCGSKVFAWMNDSAFWIIKQMAGMTEKETFTFFSSLLMVMALAGLLAVMVLSYFFPLL